VTPLVVETGACSDVGRLRQSNEDALVLSAPVYAVADGMGGARAGEVASAMAVAALHGLAGGEAELAAAIDDVNGRIHAAARADPSLMGMGTTVTAALVDGADLVVAHVGDSRAYLLRAGRLRQLTDDHSLVGELVRRGALSPGEAERHPQRSVITRALGAEPGVDIDVLRVPAEAGDLLLLCTDGLSGMVPDGEIERILQGGGSLDEMARRLIAAANGAGGEDNSTAVLLRLGEPGAMAPEPERVVIVPADALAAAPPGDAAPPAPAGPDRGRTRGVALAAAIAAGGVVLAVAIALGLQTAHFVGATPEGRLAVYQGLPINLVGDVALYRPVEIVDVPVALLDEDARRALLDQRLTSESGARDRVAGLVKSSPWLMTPPTAG
jgi:serine/threonine protein phosphatase PrpC